MIENISANVARIIQSFL